MWKAIGAEVVTYLDCIPCFLRQALEAGRMATDDEKVVARIMQQVLREAADFSLDLTPPHMGQRIHRIVRRESGHSDPYREVKARQNRLGAGWYPRLKEKVGQAPDPRDLALRLAVAGNIIDLGPPDNRSAEALEEIERSALSERLAVDHRTAFWRSVNEAKRILYLADNAGEIFLDRLLMDYLPRHKVTLAVRGRPAINDVTLEDLDGTGFDEIVEVIDNGSDAPGTILEDCSAAFLERYRSSDMIISKGQGNYETLSRDDGNIFFLLRVKCPVLARDMGCEVGEPVVAGLRPERAPARKTAGQPVNGEDAGQKPAVRMEEANE
jgi:uncharacterized protein with ATP-grasp and redox domains